MQFFYGLSVQDAGAKRRFGIVIVAGPASGTLFTLFVLPVVYTPVAAKHVPFDFSLTKHQMGARSGFFFKLAKK